MSMQLGSESRRRLEAVRRALAESWQSTSVATKLAQLIPGVRAQTYQLDATGRAFGLERSVPGFGESFQVTVDKIPRYRKYEVRRVDRFANRAVSTADLMRGKPKALAELQEAFFAPNDVWFQLRTVLYMGGRAVAHYGLFRRRTEREFDAGEVATLDALVPDLLAIEATRLAVGNDPRCPGGLTAVLDLFEQPAFLLDRLGRLTFANRRARESFLQPPAWLRTYARRDPAFASDRRGIQAAPVEVDGRRYQLVILPASAACEPSEGRAPSLVRVAELICEGLSDKEIADQTGLTLPTVRTYVARLYRRFGVHNRVGLTRLWIKVARR